MTAKVSSIDVNGWFGQYDKLTTTKKMFDELFGIDLAAKKSRYVFVDDSPNDQPMFAFFPHSVGVANVGDFISQLRWRAPHPSMSLLDCSPAGRYSDES